MIAALKPFESCAQSCGSTEGGCDSDTFEGKTLEHLLELVERVLLGPVMDELMLRADAMLLCSRRFQPYGGR